MLVCLSLAIRVSAVTFLLAQSLEWVLRCSRSHLCSGSDNQKDWVSSTELRPVPSAGLHKLSPVDRASGGCMSLILFSVYFVFYSCILSLFESSLVYSCSP